MAYIAGVCVLVGFAIQALTSTRAFEQPDHDLQNGLMVGAALLTFIGVFVHVVPLLRPVPPGWRRWLTFLLAILLAKVALDAGKAYARYWLEGAEGPSMHVRVTAA
jgi:protein-S-isoprenylcysteine O-methyltransferase Ste14